MATNPREKQREYDAKRRKDPKRIAWTKAYNKKPERKEIIKQKRQVPEYKHQRLKADRKRRMTPKGRAYSLVEAARQRARKRDMEFGLTHKWAEKIIEEGKCQLSGISFDLKLPDEGLQKQFNAYAPSIDKKNPNKGYVKSNCHIILWSLNTAKGRMQVKEFKKFWKITLEGMNNA